MVDPPRDPKAGDYERLRPGDMWIVPDDDDGYGRLLAQDTAVEYAGKPPLIVCLPGPYFFPVYSASTQQRTPWQVSGEAPNITIAPSIAVAGRYHGYIQNGVITDDVEGRKYDANGKLIRAQP